MVECEYPTYRLIVFAKNRFNRYMVECESIRQSDVDRKGTVLIDTWWNVNLVSTTVQSQHSRFNRYMVECE